MDRLTQKYCDDLFDKKLKEQKTTDTCRTCEHRQRWECRSKIFQYCGVRKSNRTDNGLLKIKCKNKVCGLYELEKQEPAND